MSNFTSSEPFRINIRSLSKAHAKYTEGSAARHVRYVISGGDDVPFGELPEGVLPKEGSAFFIRDMIQKRVENWINREEKVERKNGKMLEKIQLSFHRQITDPAIRKWMVQEFALRVGEGKVSWIAQMHEHDRDNLHAHMILRNRDRELGAKGGAPIKWMQKMGSFEKMRAIWADIVNEGLEKSGHYERVDHRSHYRQRVVKELKRDDPKTTPVDERSGSYVTAAAVRKQRASGDMGPVIRPTKDKLAEAQAEKTKHRVERGARSGVAAPGKSPARGKTVGK